MEHPYSSSSLQYQPTSTRIPTIAATSKRIHPGIRRTMASVPDEIIHDEILHKLPAKSLVRFKCVSKSFNTLISSPRFTDLHLRQSLSSNANRLLIICEKNNSNLYSIDVDSPDESATKIPLPRILDKWLGGTISIVSSFNGLLCVELLLKMGGDRSDEYKHVLINPSTGVYREIPHLSTPDVDDEFWVTFGFGFDELNNDYKLVRVFENAMHFVDEEGSETVHNREVMMYSFNEDSWYLVEDIEDPSESLRGGQNGVLLKNHLLHWVFLGYQSYQICCFDVQVDDWVNDVPLMDFLDNPVKDFDNQDMVVHVVDLGVIYGCLCVSSVTYLSRAVWIMKEYGVKKSWVKLFEIYHYFEPGRFHFYGPLGFRKGSKHEVLVQKEGSSVLFWCDIESETYGRTEEINEYPDFEDSCFFTGSLVQIPGGEKIQT